MRLNPPFSLRDVPYLGFIAALLYVGVAQAIFEYRNPMANRMSFFRDFCAVVTFDKLDKYQTK